MTYLLWKISNVDTYLVFKIRVSIQSFKYLPTYLHPLSANYAKLVTYLDLRNRLS